MNLDWILALSGGVIIGISVSLMLLWNGRVTGVSGILSGALTLKEESRSDLPWRIMFVFGLVSGGGVLSLFYPAMFTGALETPIWTLVVAGLLVGFGTNLGSGCTSGHGVCGISRLSIRSLVATGVFIAAGIVAVFFFRMMGVFS